MLFHTPKTYTVESVTSGHPDKICDQISDSILDSCLSQDPTSRVAVECLGGHGFLAIVGEVTTSASLHAPTIARKLYKRIGYKDKLKITANIVLQSPDIAMGVDTGGAGDQGIMYGYATDETPEMMPGACVLAHKLTMGLEDLRVDPSDPVEWLMPDGKSQVTIVNGRVKTVLVSTQHTVDVDAKVIKEILTERLITPLFKNTKDLEILVNPTGKFVSGGFNADTGLTGRKIMVDTYGGLIPHGGGCFSGKDPSKVDRSGAYMCRYVAKNVVASGRAKRCLVSVAYAIGKAEPLMMEVIDEKGKSLASYVRKRFDFRPKSIIEKLNLAAPIYTQTAVYGHFGKEGLPWEEIDG